MRILYVEDEPDIRDLTCLALRSIGGHDVIEFASGGEALAHLSQLGKIDLLLLDVMMPEMDGRELLKELRRSSITADVPAIFMTAKTMRSEIEELCLLGAIDVVPKPYDPLSLCDELAASLQKLDAPEDQRGNDFPQETRSMAANGGRW